MLGEWAIPPGAATPDPSVMFQTKHLTFNSRVFPGTAPLDVKKGQRVRIRLGNLSADNHSIHLHGYHFTVTAYGAGNLPKQLRYKDSTIDVPVGGTRDIQLVANVVGNWALHCHKTHHTMNGMAHGLPNLIDMDRDAVDRQMRKFFPNFKAMGTTGMGEMAYHNHMPRPPNTLPYGVPGPHGIMDMGGMFTILKVTASNKWNCGFRQIVICEKLRPFGFKQQEISYENVPHFICLLSLPLLQLCPG